MPASGCCSKEAASSASSSAICRLMASIWATAALVVAANARLTVAGTASCSVRKAARSSAARPSTLRLRPPRRSAARIWDMVSRAASRGPGAVASTPTASPWARLGNACRAPGKYSLRALRSRLVSRVRSQTSCWWARARMRTAAASSLSPATSRWLWRSVRTRSASNLASPASDLAPPTWWRSR